MDIAAVCIVGCCLGGGCGRPQADETPDAAADAALNAAPERRTAAKPAHAEYIVLTPAAKALNAAPDADWTLPADGRDRPPVPLLPESAPLALPPAAALAEPLPAVAAEHRPDDAGSGNPLRGGVSSPDANEPAPVLAEPTTAPPEKWRSGNAGCRRARNRRNRSRRPRHRRRARRRRRRRARASTAARRSIRSRRTARSSWAGRSRSWPCVITGREDGYIEPCGCAGLDRMKGGMSRRHTLFKQLRQEGWPVVGLDVGGLAKGFGKQAELKFQTMVEGKRQMGYDAIAFGADRPAAARRRSWSRWPGRPTASRASFVSANVGLFGFAVGDAAEVQGHRAAGAKLGVTAILGKQAQKQSPQRRDRDGRSRDGAEGHRARAEEEGRLPGPPGPCDGGGVDRAGQEVPRVQPGRHVRRAGRAAGQADAHRGHEDAPGRGRARRG